MKLPDAQTPTGRHLVALLERAHWLADSSSRWRQVELEAIRWAVVELGKQHPAEMADARRILAERQAIRGESQLGRR